MNRLLQAAEAVLRQHPAPALRLSELLRHVRARIGALTPDAAGLQRALAARPDRFRVLDPWRGPWKRVARDPRYPAAGDPWVVVVGDPGDQGADPGTAEPPLSHPQRRLRASVRWLGARLDGEETCSLSRFHAIAIGAEAAVERLGAPLREEEPKKAA